MTQPTHAVGSLNHSDKELTSPLASYALQNVRRRVHSSMLLR